MRRRRRIPSPATCRGSDRRDAPQRHLAAQQPRRSRSRPSNRRDHAVVPARSAPRCRSRSGPCRSPRSRTVPARPAQGTRLNNGTGLGDECSRGVRRRPPSRRPRPSSAGTGWFRPRARRSPTSCTAPTAFGLPIRPGGSLKLRSFGSATGWRSRAVWLITSVVVSWNGCEPPGWRAAVFVERRQFVAWTPNGVRRCRRRAALRVLGSCAAPPPSTVDLVGQRGDGARRLFDLHLDRRSSAVHRGSDTPGDTCMSAVAGGRRIRARQFASRCLS